MVKKHILIFTNLYPTPTEPERGIFIYQLVQELKTIYRITVICPLPWFPKLKFLPKSEKWKIFADVPGMIRKDGITAYYPKYPIIPKISDVLHSGLIFLGTLPLFIRIMAQCKFKVISAHWIYPDCVSAALFKILFRFKLVVSAKGCDLNRDIKKRLLAPQIRFALNKADYVTTESIALRDVAVAQGIQPNKAFVTPNGIDMKLFRPLDKIKCRSSLGLSITDKLIIFVGQLVPVKDHITFIKGLSFLKTIIKFPSFKAVLIGEGPLEELLKSEIMKQKLADVIDFKGQVDHKKIPIWMSSADLLCLTSVREGRPNVILESISCGCPVVASSVGGIPEIVNDKNGRLFQPGDHKKLAESIKEVLLTKWDQENIRNTVQQYTWEASASKYINIFEKLLH